LLPELFFPVSAGISAALIAIRKLRLRISFQFTTLHCYIITSKMSTASQSIVLQNMKDKVVVVSGGNSGIGKATAMLLACQGAKVAILARRKGTARVSTSLPSQKNWNRRAKILRPKRVLTR
jgi:NADPH:quinone reductase-like Zn-dependent oxidoreductase